MRRLLAVPLLALSIGAWASEAPGPSSPFLAEHPQLRPFGEATFRKWGVRVYDARLWIESDRWTPERPFALELRYAIAIRAQDLADRSIAELRKQGERDEARLARWRNEMLRVFPDISPGDTLVGVAVGAREARFYDGRRRLGTIADPGFTAAFFAIWLGERSSEPALREALLRLPE
jgi:hypothetical protein